jgi:hypothetical protein
MWVKRGTLSTFQVLFSYSNTGSGLRLSFNSDDTLAFLGGSSTGVYRDPAAWYHIVGSCAGGVLNWYVNGVLVGAASSSPSAIPSGAVMYLGRYSLSAIGYFDGEMAEINFVDGQALAPTAFGAYSIYNQWLPIKYAGTYGTNGFYLPFNSVSTSSYAGSFNGSTQYITAPSNAAFNLVANDFTVECWLYSTVAGTTQYFAGKSSSAGLANSIVFYKDPANALALYVKTAGGADITTTSVATIPLNTWTHVAGVRNGATLRLYINGVQDGTNGTISTTAVATTTEVFAVGATGSFATGRWNGSISNFRLVNGTCLYPSGTTFIPPTAALTAITNTSLLTLQNSTIVDNSTNAFTITNNGTVVTSVQSPFLNPKVLVADSSGNANNWTPNNISLTAGSTYDSLTDVPTLTSETVANYAVLNPLDKGVTVTMSSGNLKMVQSGVGTDCFRASMALPATGKWYWEIKVTAIGSGGNLGVATQSSSLAAGGSLTGILSQYTGFYAVNGWSSSGSYTAWTTNDLMAVAVDSGTGIVTFYKNGASLGAIPTALTASQTYFPFGQGTNSTYDFNFGQQPFVYTAPSGFLPLNTFNI